MAVERALTATEVLEKLSSLGVHSTDATDALDEAGANWRPSHDAEALRRRKEAANSQTEHGEVPSVRKLDDSRAEGAELMEAASLPLTTATALEVLEGLGFRLVEQRAAWTGAIRIRVLNRPDVVNLQNTYETWKDTGLYPADLPLHLSRLEAQLEGNRERRLSARVHLVEGEAVHIQVVDQLA